MNRAGNIAALFERAVAQGAVVDSPPARLERWPVTIGFIRDPDGYLVELVERDPWPLNVSTQADRGSASTAST